MKEFLSNKGVQFNEVDVAADEQARNEMLAKTGMMAVPTVTMGDQYVVGFDKAKLEKMLH